jgi:2,3-bisphosphoglycerate-independent phosphoglycerate mutase
MPTKTEGSLADAVRRAYAAGQEDETLEPIVRVDANGRAEGRIGPGDGVIFYDVRGEREVTLTRAFTDPGFSLFPVEPIDPDFVTLIEYAPRLKVRVAFPPETRLGNTLTEVMGKAGFRVFKIAESEKATHVGFFFNGKTDAVYPGEERTIVPSPRVEKYSEKPEMNAAAVVENIVRVLSEDGPRFVLANLANVDEVGHLEDREAVLRAVKAVDGALAAVLEAARREEATVALTSDHGTVEQWLYPDGTVDTGHTKNPVPFVLIDFAAGSPGEYELGASGGLADVAPTILDLVGVARPEEMTGRSLIRRKPRTWSPRRNVLLLILDGWGHREDTYGNMITEAGAPTFERLWSRYPRSFLAASGEAVGMPDGTVGNSEAGHLHLGAGRRVYLDRVRIDRAVADGSFFRNEVLVRAMERAASSGRPLHFMGIVSFYSSHGTIRHLFALMKMAQRLGVSRVYVHSFIGRRNDMPETGAAYLDKIEALAGELGLGRVVTVMGRYWSLARESTPERVEKAYRVLTEG